MVKTVLLLQEQVLDVLPQPLVLLMVQIVIRDPHMVLRPALDLALVLDQLQVPLSVQVQVSAHDQLQVLLSVQVREHLLALATLEHRPGQTLERQPAQVQAQQPAQVQARRHVLALARRPDLLLMTIQHEVPEVVALRQEQEDLKLQLPPMKVEVPRLQIDHHPILQVAVVVLPMVLIPPEVIQAPAAIREVGLIPAVVADVADDDSMIAYTSEQFSASYIECL